MDGALINNNFSLLLVHRSTSAPDEGFYDLCLLLQTNLQRRAKRQSSDSQLIDPLVGGAAAVEIQGIINETMRFKEALQLLVFS